MSKQTQTTTILKKQLEQQSTIKQKVILSLKFCKEQKITHNKQNKLITEQGLTRLIKAMLGGIKNEKQGWWSTYKVVELKNDEIQIVQKIVVKTESIKK